MPELNKFETQRTLLNENKVKRLKFQLRSCNLHFGLISLLLTLKTWSSAVSQRLNSLKYILSFVVNLLFSMEEKPFGYGS